MGYSYENRVLSPIFIRCGEATGCMGYSYENRVLSPIFIRCGEATGCMGYLVLKSLGIGFKSMYGMTAPLGATENSPAIHRWDHRLHPSLVPKGRLKHLSFTLFNHPYGTDHQRATASPAVNCWAIFNGPSRTIQAIENRSRTHATSPQPLLSAASSQTPATHLDVGAEAPEFTLEDLEGKKVGLKDLRGNVVLLNFWASWCLPCRQEISSLEKIQREYKESGLIVLGINDEEVQKAKDFLKQNSLTLLTLNDPGQKVAKLYHVPGIPTSVLIDKQGIISWQLAGVLNDQDLRAALTRLGLVAAAQPATTSVQDASRPETSTAKPHERSITGKITKRAFVGGGLAFFNVTDGKTEYAFKMILHQTDIRVNGTSVRRNLVSVFSVGRKVTVYFKPAEDFNLAYRVEF